MGGIKLHKNLERLLVELPKVISKGRADSTVAKYMAGWNGFSQWGESQNLETRPAQPFYVCLYLTHLLMEKGNKGSITTALFGIRWAHHKVGMVSPTDSDIVQLTYQGCLRSCNREKCRKEPISVEVIKKFVNDYKGKDHCLMRQRFMILCLLSFAGFFRIKELLSVKLKQIKVFKSHIEVFLTKSKTDQHREGEIVFIARTGTKYCAVSNTLNFLEKAGLDLEKDKEAYLIPTLNRTKEGHIASRYRGISYTRAHEIFRENLKDKNIDVTLYCLHSFRSGGASTAANNGVSERLISKHGRWSADTSRNGYIKDDKEKRLLISKNLGL